METEEWQKDPVTAETFVNDPEFCTTCGSILPISTSRSFDNYCPVCHFPVQRRDLAPVTYTVHFNDPDVYSKEKGHQKKKGKKDADGPLVDRECRQCGNKRMSYATLQLRSADEGQTVFYTCPKCKFKESENS